MSTSKFLLPFNELTNPYGRINRLQYAAHMALYAVVLLPFLGLAVIIMTSGFYESHPIVVLTNLTGLSIGISFLLFCLYAKRLHDLGMPAVIGLVMLAATPAGLLVLAAPHLPENLMTPFIAIGGFLGIFKELSIGIGGYLLMAPGQKSDNVYGIDPLNPL